MQKNWQTLLSLSLSVMMLASLLSWQWNTPSWACSCRSKISSLKANMHTLQTLVETYAVDWEGQYPHNLRVLQHESQSPIHGRQYWKPFHNPFTGQQGYGRAWVDPQTPGFGLKTQADPYQDILGIRFYARQNPPERSEQRKGMVVYWSNITAYVIYGLNKTGQPLRFRNGELYVLSNS